MGGTRKRKPIWRKLETILNNMDTEELDVLIEDIDAFFSNIENGDKYINGVPNKEYGLQFDLYCYLKNLGYNLVYELSLLDLKPYLDEELEIINEGYPEGSLRPDLVIRLDDGGFVCVELKYNKKSESEIIEDMAKCRVYVKHCQDVHCAMFIHLSKHELKNNLQNYPCADEKYRYELYDVGDDLVYPKGNPKSTDAYSIAELWNKKNEEIKNGEGEFADYEKGYRLLG